MCFSFQLSAFSYQPSAEAKPENKGDGSIFPVKQG